MHFPNKFIQFCFESPMAYFLLSVNYFIEKLQVVVRSTEPRRRSVIVVVNELINACMKFEIPRQKAINMFRKIIH